MFFFAMWQRDAAAASGGACASLARERRVAAGAQVIAGRASPSPRASRASPRCADRGSCVHAICVEQPPSWKSRPSPEFVELPPGMPVRRCAALPRPRIVREQHRVALRAGVVDPLRASCRSGRGGGATPNERRRLLERRLHRRVRRVIARAVVAGLAADAELDEVRAVELLLHRRRRRGSIDLGIAAPPADRRRGSGSRRRARAPGPPDRAARAGHIRARRQHAIAHLALVRRQLRAVELVEQHRRLRQRVVAADALLRPHPAPATSPAAPSPSPSSPCSATTSSTNTYVAGSTCSRPSPPTSTPTKSSR